MAAPIKRKTSPARQGPTKFMVGRRHDAAIILNKAGWEDSQIAEALSVSGKTVRVWRHTHDIAPPHNTIDSARALEMYQSGANDREIADVFGVLPSSICHWRRRRGLPATIARATKLSLSELRKAKALLRKGASKRQVADELGRASVTFARKLRRTMTGEKGLRATGVTTRDIRSRALRLDPAQLLNRIRRAVGSSFSRDIDEEAVAELCSAVLEGRVLPEDIERKAKCFVHRVLDQFAPIHGPLSIDMRDEDGFSLGDKIVDDGALAAMEASAEYAFASLSA